LAKAPIEPKPSPVTKTLVSDLHDGGAVIAPPIVNELAAGQGQ
jgi:hypothetical protein